LILIANPHEHHLKSTEVRGQGFAARGTKVILVPGGNHFQKPPLYHQISEQYLKQLKQARKGKVREQTKLIYYYVTAN
jgi:hypothetical protein